MAINIKSLRPGFESGIIQEVTGASCNVFHLSSEGLKKKEEMLCCVFVPREPAEDVRTSPEGVRFQTRAEVVFTGRSCLLEDLRGVTQPSAENSVNMFYFIGIYL